MISQLCTLSLLLVFAQGKPVTYDQRQDGNVNFQAQLDNVMVVIATPGDKGPSSLFSDIASQILELRSLTSRNKKVSVEDEEIVEQGKDPLSVKILRIEGQNDAGENENQSQAAVNPIKAFDLPKNDDTKQVLNRKDEYTEDKIKEIPKKIEVIKEKKNPELLEGGKKDILQKLEKTELIPEKLEKEVPFIAENQKIIPAKEEILHKFISHGTIVEVDGSTGKIVNNLEDKKPLANRSIDKNLEKIDLQEKILEKSSSDGKEKIIPRIQEKAAILAQEREKVEEKTVSRISPISVEKEIVPKKLLNQDEKIEDKLPEGIEKHETTKYKKKEVSEVVENKVNKEEKIAGKNERKVVPEGRRTKREFRAPVNDSKSRMSLKKQLPRIEDRREEDAAGDKNEVRLIVEEISQLKPIGDMIENCGPGRIRNRYGVCQFDESFN